MTTPATCPQPCIDTDHLKRQAEWSTRTFGPGPRLGGVLDHITKELDEIRADPTDLGEWVDVVILALDGALRAGHAPSNIIQAIKDKQARNEARSWPDWRTMSQDKAIEHDRADDEHAVRVYIAGPIGGVPDARVVFDTAAAAIAAHGGYEPVNPFNVLPHAHDGECPPGYSPGEGESEHTSSACYMRADLAALLTCDAIYMLHGWQESRGATVEHTIATALGLPITYAGGAA